MPEVNKYELELAIDQYKLQSDPKTISLIESPDGFYEYGSQRFVTREAAEWWIQTQIVDHEKIMTQIRSERKMFFNGKIHTNLEPLYALFEEFYMREKGVKKTISQATQELNSRIIQDRAKSVPRVTIPILDPLNLKHLTGIGWFTLGESEIPVYGNDSERVLPLPDASIEHHGMSYEDLGEFVRASIGSLSGSEIDPKVATEVARRVVRIEADQWSGTGFIREGRTYTNDHVLRGATGVRVFDLLGKELTLGERHIDMTHTPSRESPVHDVAYIELDSSYGDEYLGTPSVNIPGGYIFGIKPHVHESISPARYGTNSIAFWIQKFENIDDTTSTDDEGEKYKNNFRYRGNTNTISGVSGSIVYYNGETIGLHSWGGKKTSEYHKLYGVFPVDVSPIGGTMRNEDGYGGGVFFDEIKK